MSERPGSSDPANYLRTAEEVEMYLRGAIRERDVSFLLDARRHAQRAIARWNIALTSDLRALLGGTGSDWQL